MGVNNILHQSSSLSRPGSLDKPMDFQYNQQQPRRVDKSSKRGLLETKSEWEYPSSVEEEASRDYVVEISGGEWKGKLSGDRATTHC